MVLDRAIGDIAGAAQQVAEIAALIGLLIALRP
jgi:hypothetical protein